MPGVVPNIFANAMLDRPPPTKRGAVGYERNTFTQNTAKNQVIACGCGSNIYSSLPRVNRIRLRFSAEIINLIGWKVSGTDWFRPFGSNGLASEVDFNFGTGMSGKVGGSTRW